MNGLSAKHCVPCRGGEPPMDEEEVKKRLLEVPDWYLEDGKLVRNFSFKDFKAAMSFTNKVADLAESEGHHPNILVHNWNKVKLILYTHKIGGLHENDFILAAKINTLPA